MNYTLKAPDQGDICVHNFRFMTDGCQAQDDQMERYQSDPDFMKGYLSQGACWQNLYNLPISEYKYHKALSAKVKCTTDKIVFEFFTDSRCFTPMSDINNNYRGQLKQEVLPNTCNKELGYSFMFEMAPYRTLDDLECKKTAGELVDDRNTEEDFNLYVFAVDVLNDIGLFEGECPYGKFSSLCDLWVVDWLALTYYSGIFWFFGWFVMLPVGTVMYTWMWAIASIAFLFVIFPERDETFWGNFQLYMLGPYRRALMGTLIFLMGIFWSSVPGVNVLSSLFFAYWAPHDYYDYAWEGEFFPEDEE